MKIKIEPDRAKKLIEAGMIHKSKAMIDPVMFQFNKDGVTVADLYSDVIAVHMNLSKKYFLGYESDEESIGVPSIILDRLGWGFKDEEIEMSTKDNKLSMKGKSDSFDTPLEDLEKRPFPFKMKDTEHGLIPEKIEVKSAIKLKADDLKLPPSNLYVFELKGKKLTVSIPNGGNFVRKLQGKIIGEEDIKVALEGEYFNCITNNLDGDVTFILDENAVIFAEKKKDHTKTYIMSTQEEV